MMDLLICWTHHMSLAIFALLHAWKTVNVAAREGKRFVEI